MVTIDNRKRKLDKFLAVLLGLSVSEGISAMFTIGSTTFTFAELISPLMCIFFCSRNGRILTSFIRTVPIGFKLFGAVIVLSIIPGLVYFMSISIVPRYIVGLVYLLIVLTTAIDAFYLSDLREKIILGIFIGLIINVLFSLICYVSFQRGVTISLNNLIGRNSFYVPLYSFRSQGFFMEPSHFSRYVISTIILVISTVKIRNFLIKLLLIVATLIALGLSYSGSLAILMIGLLIYYLGGKKGLCLKVHYRTVATIYVILFVCVMIAMGVVSVEVSDISVVADRIIRATNIADEGNYARYVGIVAVMQQWDAAVLGCGWNLVGTLIEQKSLGTVSAFSDLLEMVIETGIHGGMIYVASTVFMGLRLWRLREPYSRALSISLLMILALQIGTDYAFNSCIMLVFGLAVAQLRDSTVRCANAV